MCFSFLFVTADKRTGGRRSSHTCRVDQVYVSRCSVRTRVSRSVLSGRDGATESSLSDFSGRIQGIRAGYPPRRRGILPPIVSERFVRFSHLVRVFALLDRVAAIVRRIENLAGELVLH